MRLILEVVRKRITSHICANVVKYDGARIGKPFALLILCVRGSTGHGARFPHKGPVMWVSDVSLLLATKKLLDKLLIRYVVAVYIFLNINPFRDVFISGNMKSYLHVPSFHNIEAAQVRRIINCEGQRPVKSYIANTSAFNGLVTQETNPDSIVHGANMWPTWVQ